MIPPAWLCVESGETIDHLAESTGARAPWLFLALSASASVSTIWRLEVMEDQGFGGTGLGTLVIEGADGSPVTLNRPCGPPPGRQRRVANHLGVFAQRLPAKR